MSAFGRGTRLLRDAVHRPSFVCSRCAIDAKRTSGHRYTSAASAPTPTPPTSLTPPPAPQPAPPVAPSIRSGLILTRAPLLTRRLHSFETAFYFYQKRLEERLNSAFITPIYFKPDTARRLDWALKVGEREGTVAKELGRYKGKSARAWDDELRVGDPLSSTESLYEFLLKDAEPRVSEDAEVIAPEDRVPVERPAPRETGADRSGDVARLDRKLDRTLYLVLKGSEGWGFPSDVLRGDENLHEAAKRILTQSAGINMNTWLVGRVPVAHLVDGAASRKTFFLKAHILAGQADLTGNALGYDEFRWLTREELEALLAPEYFHGVRNMMAVR